MHFLSFNDCFLTGRKLFFPLQFEGKLLIYIILLHHHSSPIHDKKVLYIFYYSTRFNKFLSSSSSSWWKFQPWLYFDNFFFADIFIIQIDTNRFGTRRFMLESLLNKRASDKHDNLISFQSLPAVAAYSTDAVCSIIIIIFSSHLVKEFLWNYWMRKKKKKNSKYQQKFAMFFWYYKFLCLLKNLSL